MQDNLQNMQGEPSLIPLIIMLGIILLLVISMWKVFTKAGKPGWTSIIPIYNLFVLIEIAGKPWWWFFLMLIPLVNIVVTFLVVMGISTNFGKGTGFAIGLFLLGAIFYPILAFGSATYNPPAEPA